jgi:thymidylate synthase
MNRSYNEFDSFDSAFVCLSRELVGIDTQNPKAGSYISSPRDQEVREILAKAFVINNPRHRITGVPARKFSLEYLAAELVWYFSGHNTCDWIERHASFWSQIQNSDGTINSAYGDRIFNRGMLKGGPRTVVGKLDRNQWQMVLDELRKDPSSRRAVMHIKTIDDGFDEKDVPCTLTWSFICVQTTLCLVLVTMFLRSR